MNITVHEIQTNSLSSFRNFAREIRNPSPYKFAVTECKGTLNIIIGLGQILVCPCFKVFKAEKLYEVHMDAGTTALKQGIKDLTPALAVTAIVIVGVVTQNWLHR